MLVKVRDPNGNELDTCNLSVAGDLNEKYALMVYAGADDGGLAGCSIATLTTEEVEEEEEDTPEEQGASSTGTSVMSSGDGYKAK